MLKNLTTKIRSKGQSLIIGNNILPLSALTEDHCIELGLYIKKFGADTTNGLSEAQAAERKAKDGPNVLSPAPEKPLIIQFLQEMYRGFNVVLWIGSLLCFLSWQPLGNPPSVYNLALALVLAFVALFSAVFNFIQNRYSSNIIASFLKIVPRKTHVMRESQWIEIDAVDVVVGDMVKINSGEQFPADMRIIECRQAKLEKASLTGESEPISLTTQPTDKNMLETRNLAFFGTSLLEGNCVGVVSATGDRTVMGKIAKLTAKGE